MRCITWAVLAVAASGWFAAAVLGQVPDDSQTANVPAVTSTDSILAPGAGVGTPATAPAEPQPSAPRETRRPAPAETPVEPRGARPRPAPQPAATAAGQKTISLVKINFTGEVDLRAFLDYVSKATGKNFLYDDKSLAGRVILLAPTEIPEDRLFELLESLLEYEGFALEPSSTGLIKVRRSGDLLKRPIPLLMPEDLDALADSDKIVTTAYELAYISVTEVQTAVAPLVSVPQGSIAPIQRSNMLLVTDTVSNLKRIARIVRRMDNEKNVPKLEIIQCKFAKAETLAGQIARVVRTQETGGAQPSQQQALNFDYDPSSNSVIVVAPEPTLVKVRRLVAMLDVEPPASASTWRIYPLKNTKAEDVATTLKQLSEGMPTGVVRGVPGMQPPRAPGAEMPGPITVGEVKILGDKNTNSIIVVGPVAAQRSIADLIAALDKRRNQVLIEALVVQVSGGSELDIGAELATWAGGEHGAGAVTSFNFSKYDYTKGTRAISEGEGLTNWIVNSAEIPFLLRMLLVENGGKIISRPRLLANDNTEARFESIDESPYTSVSSVTTNTSTTSFSGYQKAGTELKITPHISEKEYLSLEIELNLSQFTGAGIAGTETTPGVPPPRRSDNLKTAVTVPNQTTIVIGGLSGAHKTEMIRQVPVLGKIPLLGALFRRKVTKIDDTIEYIFIKAQIASDEDFSDLRGLSKESELESEKLRQAPAGVIPKESKEAGGI